MNWADLLVVLVMLGFTMIGFSGGLIMSFYRLVSIFIAFFLSIKLYPVISSILVKTPIYTAISTAISSSIKKYTVDTISTTSNDVLSSISAGISLPPSLKNSLLNGLTHKVSNVDVNLLGIDSIINYIGNHFAGIVIDMISLVAVFILISVILTIVGLMIKKIRRVPILYQIDKTAGALFGALAGIIVLFITFAVISSFYFLPTCREFMIAIDNSTIAKFFCQNNFLLTLF